MKRALSAWSAGLAVAALVLALGPLPAASQDGAPAPGSLGLEQGEKLAPERLEALYRQVLARWAAGEDDRAAGDLIELETTAVTEGDIPSRQRLLKAQQAVIQELFNQDAEVLVPIAMLHHEVYRRYVAWEGRGHAVVTSHGRTMVHDLAVLYEKNSDGEGSAVVASRILTSLGGLLQDSAQHLIAARLFSRAAELDGRNTVSLLALAKIYEKNGDYESAVGMLRRAVAVDPAAAEPRLRLAVNLERIGRTDDARTTLEELAASAESSWVAPLVYQQLADLHRRAGSLGKAEAVLKTAMGKFPQNARIYVQLASVLDRKGDLNGSRLVLQQVLDLPPGSDDPSRHRYNSAASEGFEQVRAALEADARSRLPALALAVGAPAAAVEVGR